MRVVRDFSFFLVNSQRYLMKRLDMDYKHNNGKNVKN